MKNFSGCKLALLFADELLVYKRDNKDSIPFPGRFDLPGGGRESNESPSSCVLRELFEEFSLTLEEDRLIHTHEYLTGSSGNIGYFFVAHLYENEVSQIKFGDEGVYWMLMPIETYLVHPNGIPHLQKEMSLYLSSNESL